MYATLATPLSALGDEAWQETFEFFIDNEHKPAVFGDGADAEIVLRPQGSTGEPTVLTTGAAEVLIDGNAINTAWDPPTGGHTGLWDFRVRIKLDGGDFQTRLVGQVEFATP